jgi:predicted RNase H-like HicB family nuclease
MAMYKFSIVLEKEDNMYVSHNVQLGVASQGKTVEEAIANIKEASELYVKHCDKSILKPFLKNREPISANIEVTGA